MKAMPLLRRRFNIKRKKKAGPPQAQTLSVQLTDPTREVRKPSPYQEKRMENIARNQEMVRKLFVNEGYASPAMKVNIKRKKKAGPGPCTAGSGAERPVGGSHARAA
jgi:hypothetical protein